MLFRLGFFPFTLPKLFHVLCLALSVTRVLWGSIVLSLITAQGLTYTDLEKTRFALNSSAVPLGLFAAAVVPLHWVAFASRGKSKKVHRGKTKKIISS